MSAPYPPYHLPPSREPVFNVPGIVAGLVGALVLIHAVRMLVLSEDADIEVLLFFAFIPARYAGGAPFPIPQGLGVDAWTFVTYAFLHANLVHLVVNSIWLLAFGTPVARRFGALRFALFFAVTAAAGALAHWLTHPGEFLPMVGASAAISGAMAAAVRFAFVPGGSLSGRRAPAADHQPAASLLDGLKDKRVLGFVAVWVGLNVIFGLGVALPGTGEAEVAWQAHIGGFLAGLLLFQLFDPVPRTPPRATALLP